jgi:hypothetical protein
VPPPLAALAAIAHSPDELIASGGEQMGSPKALLYDLLRDEQRLAAAQRPDGMREIDRILDLAQAAYCRLVALLVGRADASLDSARDGDWSLRDLLRHVIAVEIRYAAQVEWAARRADTDPLAIPPERLPGDRTAPPEPEYAATRTGGILDVLDLLGRARAAADERMSAISDSVLERPSLWGRREMTVRMRLHQTAAHLIEAHVHADKMLGARVDGEARRILHHTCAARGAHERWSDARERAALDQRYVELSVRSRAR